MSLYLRLNGWASKESLGILSEWDDLCKLVLEGGTNMVGEPGVERLAVQRHSDTKDQAKWKAC